MLTTQRVALLVLGALNVGCGATLLAAGDYLPQPARVAVVVVQAVLVWVLAQMQSWSNAGPNAPPH